MKKEKKITLIIILFLCFPFCTFSKEKRGDIPPPITCDIFFSSKNILFDNINIEDFLENRMGILADETYIQTFSLVFNDCTRDDINIKLSIDPITIDLTNGYLKNNAPSSLASKNITFQLLDEDKIPIDLTKKNIFNQLTKNSEAEFYFSLNYVKKDNDPPSTGEISSDIIINVEINNEIIKIEDKKM